MWYEDLTRDYFFNLAKWSAQSNLHKLAVLGPFLYNTAAKLRIQTSNLRVNASKAILRAYTGNEKSRGRDNVEMSIQCGKFIIKINPYVDRNRKKTVNQIAIEYD